MAEAIFSQAWKLEVQGQGAGRLGFSYHSKASLLSLKVAASSLCPHVVFPL